MIREIVRHMDIMVMVFCDVYEYGMWVFEYIFRSGTFVDAMFHFIFLRASRTLKTGWQKLVPYHMRAW